MAKTNQCEDCHERKAIWVKWWIGNKIFFRKLKGNYHLITDWRAIRVCNICRQRSEKAIAPFQ